MNETTATRYQRLRRRVRAAGLISGAVLLSVVALTPIARAAAAWISTRVASPTLDAVILVSVLVLLLEAAALPGILYVERHGVGRTRRARTPASELIAAQGQATLVALGLAVAGALVWSLSVWLGGAQWWALATALLAGLVVAGLRGAPALLARLGDVRPLVRPGLAATLADVARRSGVDVAGVQEWLVADGADASALVTGAGRTRRVLVASPVLRDWTDDEIAVVVAHELAHHRHHDLHVALVVDALVVAAAGWTSHIALVNAGTTLGLGGPADLAALPFLMLVAGAVWVGSTPVRLAVSRWQERRADRFALTVTGGAEAFRAAVRRLGAQHLAEERPALLTRLLFQRHPTVAERVAMADAYRATAGRTSG